MTLVPLVPPAQRMTWRARAWVITLALRNLGIGCFALFASEQFHGGSYVTIKSVLPLEAWGVLYIVVAINALLALVFENEWWARLTISCSAGVTLAWAVGFAVAGIRGMATAPIGPIVWGALTLKDLVVAAMPFRSPFEHMLADDGG